MRSTFLGFNTVKSGLFAAQRALDITGHNISNVNTKGFTRQRLLQASSTPISIFGGRGMLGTGVDSIEINQFRNEFLDFKYRGEVNAQGYWDSKQKNLEFIEAIFNEPSETGISTVLDEMFSSFQELSKNPESLTTRALVRQRGIAFTNSLNHMYGQLEKMSKDLNFDVEITVSSINAIANQISILNDQVFRAEIDGSNANDLRDQRNLLIDQLSRIVDVEIVEMVDINDHVTRGQDNDRSSKKLVIQINGQPLVSHDKSFHLSTETTKASTFDDQVEMYDIRWANGAMFDTDGISGELKALIDMRDGNTGNNKGVPYYIERLNEFARVFANEVNKIHVAGFGLDGAQSRAFFTTGGVITPAGLPTDPNHADWANILDEAHGSFVAELGGINAKNISISLDIDTNLNAIGASVTTDLLPGDGSMALELAQLRHVQRMYNEGKPEDFVKSLISNLGVDSQEAVRMVFNQNVLTDQVENQRQSISGVSLDEEMTKMIQFQHAYNASARMITTMDEMIDIIINRMGLVGR
ncbi:MAG: flagellar hook-associated protein FlgK [Alkaliphilus sp.]|nr:flagellar hook-associated protein FlgK [Alkaliphilus sp. AH-315-G20]MBN4069927.1 flagellar hook-associated protein FlgK [bacterium AH-315-G05]PHS35394.1 MAG: flagellar hook-associated protein FlgK [Alkaliphilus sp.]